MYVYQDTYMYVYMYMYMYVYTFHISYVYMHKYYMYRYMHDMSGLVRVWFDVNPFPIYVVHSKTFELR